MILQYFGITELLGDINTGKTAVCIEESKKYYTMYICTTNFPIKRIQNPTDNILIKLVRSLDEILIAIRYCRTICIELLIIDNLSSVLEDDSNSKVIRLIYYLKKMIFRDKLKVLVVNNTNDNFNKSKMYFSYKLGLEWEYHINTRYHLYKTQNENIIEIVKSPIELAFKYTLKISKTSIKYFDNQF